jgi:hypothetical protein
MGYKTAICLVAIVFVGLASCSGEKTTAQKCTQLNNEAVNSFFDNRNDPEALDKEVISKLERATDMCPSDHDISTNLLIYLSNLNRELEAQAHAQNWLQVNGDSAMFRALDAIREYREAEGG